MPPAQRRPARHLVIFARAPRLGRVKRRLAKDLGALAALRFHRLNTQVLLRRLSGDPRWTTWLAVTPDVDARGSAAIWRHRGPLLAQGGGDLGARMGRVLRWLPPGPVVIVGSDIPGIDPPRIAAAFRALAPADFVLGPADDGGYWLIGARRRPALRLPFAGVRWGGANALADTRANMVGEMVLLDELQDVDTAADLAQVDPATWTRLVIPPRRGAP
ncbi:MAG: TIGR04282 family arsenosugar biosynthesis glycosyltransferase [Kiloniellales bacterium]|nr:TIGR04282 family arsenosugar biosynthesis glycosyltransferase [Kiloniellales bacterium]